MQVELVVRPENIEYGAGGMPMTYGAPEGAVERFELDVDPFVHPYYLDDNGMLNDFFNPVNERCDVALGISDVDFFDARLCRLLISWMEGRLSRPVPDWILPLYEKMLEFARRAVELGTCMVVEL